MEAQASHTALQRKMAAARDGTRRSGRSALAALRLAMARSAADLFDMSLSVIGATQSRCLQETLGANFSDDHLLILLDGPEGSTGAARVDRVTLTALIQQQTTGRVVDGEPDDRPFTATDAAMMAPLIDAAIERAFEMTDADLDKQCLEGFRFGARAEDRHNLMLALEADRYRLFDLTLEFESGVQQGVLCLVLPDRVPAQPRKGEKPTQTGPCLDRAVSTVRADLMAVVGRVRISLSALSNLEVGSVLVLDQQKLSEADLHGIDGRKVATAGLGQSGGMRAVRLKKFALSPSASDQSADFEALANAALTKKDVHAPVSAQADFPHDISTNDMDATIVRGDPARTAAVKEDDDSSDSAMLGMSTEDVAAEISQLAGLSLEDEETVP